MTRDRLIEHLDCFAVDGNLSKSAESYEAILAEFDRLAALVDEMAGELSAIADAAHEKTILESR